MSVLQLSWSVFFFRSCLLNFLRRIFAKVCENRLRRAVHKILQIAKKGYPGLLRKLLKNSQKFERLLRNCFKNWCQCFCLHRLNLNCRRIIRLRLINRLDINSMFGLILAPNSSTLDSSVIEDVITDETNLGPKFVWTLDLYLDDLSFSDR